MIPWVVEDEAVKLIGCLYCVASPCVVYGENKRRFDALRLGKPSASSSSGELVVFSSKYNLFNVDSTDDATNILIYGGVLICTGFGWILDYALRA